ncbi:Rha family transcriptional regulator [Campylobacter jejuni]|nr:Rha family transcriptional regulator [Campylobacter jejuni]EKJ3586492.1 Rha family transcriptional regulator [Campylobacter jejuni]
MSDLVVINGINVEFEVVGDQTFTTSLDIAAVFEKRHDNIIAQIKALPQDNFTHLNFKVSNYKDSTGRTLPCYKLTRDAFSLLVMGFTGEKAYKWKTLFIKAFNEMEKRLKGSGFNDLSLIDELKNSNLTKDEYKRQTRNLKDELLEAQRELLNFYRNKESKKQKIYKLDDSTINKLKKLKTQGLSNAQIKDELKISDSSIRKYTKDMI